MLEQHSISPTETDIEYLRKFLEETEKITDEVNRLLDPKEFLVFNLVNRKISLLPEYSDKDNPNYDAVENEHIEFLTDSWFVNTNPLWLSSEKNPIEAFLSHKLYDKVTASRTKLGISGNGADIYLELNIYNEDGLQPCLEFSGNDSDGPANNNLKRHIGLELEEIEENKLNYSIISSETEVKYPKSYQSEYSFFRKYLEH